jgi:hypothetical protein
LTAIELDDLYDDETLARIEQGPTRSRAGTVRRVRSGAVAGAVAAAVMIGVREAFDPPERVEIEAIDPWTDGGRRSRVRVHWDPVPWLSVAEVRW